MTCCRAVCSGRVFNVKRRGDLINTVMNLIRRDLKWFLSRAAAEHHINYSVSTRPLCDAKTD